MTDKEKYDFIDHVVHLTLLEEDRLLNEHGGDYDGLEEDGIDSNEYYRIITERVIDTLKKNNNYMQEEPVSEDLEEAASSFAREDSEGISNPANFYYTVADKARIFKAGAEWQEKKMQSTIELAEDHAMLAGMEKMREKMMKDAVGGYVIEDIEEGNGDFLLSADYLPASMGLKDQQKVKVIVIKDE